MLWLILAVLCSLSIAMLFKYSERRGLDRIALLAVNYGVASSIAVLLLIAEGESRPFDASIGLVALGVGTGVLFIFGFVIFAYAIREAGMGLATGVMRISVVLPFMASWVFWNEIPSVLQMTGLGLAGASFFLIAQPARATEHGVADTPKHAPLWMLGVLGLLFLSGGLVDVCMKAFGELYSATNSRSLFLLFVFSVAFLVGIGFVFQKGLRKGAWPDRHVYGWGGVLGLVNYGSAAFILGAINELPGPVVFPVNNIAIVGGATVLGIGIWGERISKTNWIGLALAAVALALLWG